MSSARSRERIARNFVRRYGHARFRELIEALSEGRSGPDIALAFEVSRERVRQWKNTFGAMVVLYQVHPEVSAVLDESERPLTSSV